MLRSAPICCVPVAAVLMLAGALAAQTPAAVTPSAPAGASAASAASAPLTPLVQPATTELAQALPALRPEKWKLSNELRRRNEENVSSISTDLSSTLPGLLAAADAAPGQLQPMLALSRNLHALYDVVLRVVATAEIAAPDQQTAALNHALGSLSSARQSLDQQMDAAAAAEQKRVGSLESSLAAANSSLAQARATLQKAETPAKTTTTKARVHHHHTTEHKDATSNGTATKPSTPPAQ